MQKLKRVRLPYGRDAEGDGIEYSWRWFANRRRLLVYRGDTTIRKIIPNSIEYIDLMLIEGRFLSVDWVKTPGQNVMNLLAKHGFGPKNYEPQRINCKRGRVAKVCENEHCCFTWRRAKNGLIVPSKWWVSSKCHLALIRDTLPTTIHQKRRKKKHRSNGAFQMAHA
jgi:hypothetical protein